MLKQKHVRIHTANFDSNKKSCLSVYMMSHHVPQSLFNNVESN